ncbi:hypothetical protein AGLY_009068 [Aphis glycines]|uniref:Uncharacterized protein n=1 Tax=Aphis glycines TaxID=307491 RepID=A0A6G0TKH4_APHGL|nr:hypothetical protein AGLY_009068 [Aphis glycines]
MHIWLKLEASIQWPLVREPYIIHVNPGFATAENSFITLQYINTSAKQSNRDNISSIIFAKLGHKLNRTVIVIKLTLYLGRNYKYLPLCHSEVLNNPCSQTVVATLKFCSLTTQSKRVSKCQRRNTNRLPVRIHQRSPLRLNGGLCYSHIYYVPDSDYRKIAMAIQTKFGIGTSSAYR